MGVIPFEFTSNQNRKNLNLSGEEFFTIKDICNIGPKKIIDCKIESKNLSLEIKLLCRIDTYQELEYFKSGGILQYVLNNIVKNNS